MLYSLISAFLMYSRIPMPQIPWEEKNRRYALCFFPLIGAVIGGFLLGWYALAQYLALPASLFAVIAVCLPVFVTGGIHLDGFCDTEDARASCADKAKMLQIMSDPHIGSFAVMRLVLYILVQAVCMANIGSFRSAGLCACVFCVSRTLSGLAAVTFRCAKKEGTLQDFVKPAHKHFTVIWLVCLLLTEAAGMLVTAPVPALVSLCLAGGALLYYKSMAYRTFGGITGDTAGWFLQICELLMTIGIVIIAGLR